MFTAERRRNVSEYPPYVKSFFSLCLSVSIVMSSTSLRVVPRMRYSKVKKGLPGLRAISE